VLVPGAGGRSGLTSTHPAPRLRAGGCHDHMSGTGLLSHVIERGAGAGSCRRGELTRGLATLPSHGRRGGLYLGKQVPGAGQQLLVLDPQLVLDLGPGTAANGDPVAAAVRLPADRERYDDGAR